MKTFKFGESNIFLHRNDLPKKVSKNQNPLQLILKLLDLVLNETDYV